MTTIVSQRSLSLVAIRTSLPLTICLGMLGLSTPAVSRQSPSVPQGGVHAKHHATKHIRASKSSINDSKAGNLIQRASALLAQGNTVQAVEIARQAISVSSNAVTKQQAQQIVSKAQGKTALATYRRVASQAAKVGDRAGAAVALESGFHADRSATDMGLQAASLYEELGQLQK